VPGKPFWRDASDRLTFEMFDVPAGRFGPLCGAVAAAFQMTPEGEGVTNGVDVAFRDYRRGEQAVGLAWDNWTGFTVFAKTPASEPLVNEIAEWLSRSEWAAVPGPPSGGEGEAR
jgi:hypothetical protein